MKLAAIKFMQRVILVQTRGVTDPRVSHSTYTLRNRCSDAICPLPSAPEQERPQLVHGSLRPSFHSCSYARSRGSQATGRHSDHTVHQLVRDRVIFAATCVLMFVCRNPDILSAVINSWSQLVKLRPALVELVVSSLASWTPAALAGLPATHIKSVEKAVRILLMHISRYASTHL